MKKNELKSLNPLNLPLEKQREYAKIGMGVSMALTAGTALLMKNPTANKLHILSGVALVGFSLWHYSLYPKSGATKMRESAKNTSLGAIKMRGSAKNANVGEVNALKVRANRGIKSPNALKVRSNASLKSTNTRKARTNKAPSKA